MKRKTKWITLCAALSLSFAPVAAVVSCGTPTEDVTPSNPDTNNNTPQSPTPDQSQNQGQDQNQDNGAQGDSNQGGADTPDSTPPSSGGESTNPAPGPNLPPSPPADNDNSSGQTEPSTPPPVTPAPPAGGEQDNGGSTGPVLPPAPPPAPAPSPEENGGGSTQPDNPETKPEESVPTPPPVVDNSSPELKALKEKIKGITVLEGVYHYDNVYYQLFTEPGSTEQFAMVVAVNNLKGENQVEVPAQVSLDNGATYIKVKAIGKAVFMQGSPESPDKERDFYVANSVYNGWAAKMWLNDNIEYIFDGAFAGINNHQNGLPFYGGNNIKWIGKGAFYNSSLADINNGQGPWSSSSLMYIDEKAFYSDWNIRNLNIPQSVEFIGDAAFGYLHGSEFNHGTLPARFKDQLPAIFAVPEGDKLISKISTSN